MARLAPAEYTKPTPAEKPNPFVEAVRPFVEQGIDTAFAVEFEAKDYKAEKLLIQKAVNSLGFSTREVETTWDNENEPTGKTAVKSTFLIRPPRKRKGSEDAAESDAE